WMARYLIRLGRELGEGRHWSRAVALLDGTIGRLGALGLALRQGSRRDDETACASFTAPGVWALQTMLIETMLDLARFDYGASARCLILQPTLPPPWPHIGLSQPFPCGEVGYRLERPVGGTTYRLTVTAKLHRPEALCVDLTCPGLNDLGPWRSSP